MNAVSGVENGMVIGAASAYERSLPERTDYTVELAVGELLANVEEFTNDLSHACTNRTNVSSDWFLRFPERLAQADDAVVLQAMLLSEDRGDANTVMRCAGLLKRRYLDRNSESLQQRADEIARGLAADASRF